MKTIIQLEETAMCMLSVYALYSFHVEWWWYLLLFLGPDISMLAYLAGNTTGAIGYNLFHHKGVAICFFAAGFSLGVPILLLIGIVIFGHSSFDRMMGYGLKYFTGFHFTHLGKIGPEK